MDLDLHWPEWWHNQQLQRQSCSADQRHLWICKWADAIVRADDEPLFFRRTLASRRYRSMDLDMRWFQWRYSEQLLSLCRISYRGRNGSWRWWRWRRG